MVHLKVTRSLLDTGQRCAIDGYLRLRECSKFAQLNSLALHDKSFRIRAIAGFTRRSEAVGTTEPVDITFALGHLVGQAVPKTSLRRGSDLAASGRTGSAGSDANHDVNQRAKSQ